MTHLPFLISDLALILCTAAVVTLVFKKIKQPVVLGYILAGFLVGPNVNLIPTVAEKEGIQIWAEIGVIFLMFTLGLEFSFRKLIKVGSVAAIAALVEISFTLFTGFIAGQAMGWDFMNSLFLGGILAIASTGIIVRSFEELKIKTQKFTQVVLGILVIEDLIAVILMVMLSTIAVSRTFEGGEMIYSVLKLSFFLIIWFVSGIFFLPTLMKKLKHYLNDEMLLLISLALCFLMVILASEAGYSAALGAFIMGSVLAETNKAEKIEILISPLKTLFVAVFFVSVGMLMDPEILKTHYIPVLTGVIILVIFKPFYVITGSLIAGQPLKNSIQSGMSLSQIGEFSFIIAGMGVSLGVTEHFLYPVAIAVSVITTFTTPFMIKLSEPVYLWLNQKLPVSFLEKIHRYSLGSQKIRNEGNWKKLIRCYILDVILYSVIIITILILTLRIILPVFPEFNGSGYILAGLSITLLMPFLWALAFRNSGKMEFIALWKKPLFRGPLIVMFSGKIILTLVFLSFLFIQLFQPLAAIIGIFVSVLIIFLLRKKIHNFYSRIEVHFKQNLNDRSTKKNHDPETLIPWDAHFARFEIDSNSLLIGKKLEDLLLREKFGINITLIERADKNIIVPAKSEMVFPGDSITVIGTDEQLNIFSEFLENNNNDEIEISEHEIVLHSFEINETSYLKEKNIRDSKIRELTHGLIVGIERSGNRILNPNSDFIFKVGDVIWLAGDKNRVEIYLKNILNPE